LIRWKKFSMTLQWRGAVVTFEIVPVSTSQETRAVVSPFLESAPQTEWNDIWQAPS
jgi:uncharacterized protein DUF3303